MDNIDDVAIAATASIIIANDDVSVIAVRRRRRWHDDKHRGTRKSVLFIIVADIVIM
jgi:ribosomal protein L21